VGWKGLVNDPNLDGSFDINRGLRLARQLLVDVNSMGVPCAIEFLDTLKLLLRLLPQLTLRLLSISLSIMVGKL
jgi:phospho-2-dehydro-3-deoxyheptonate aldolase